MKIKLDTIILFVHDVAHLKTFYVDTFKFDVIDEIKTEWVLLNCGGCNIGLHQVGKEYDTDAKHHSNAKIVFEVDDIYSLRDVLILHNIHAGEIKTFENYDYWVCDGADPEGNIFQLKQRK